MKYWTTKSGLKIFQILGGRCNCYLVSTRNNYLLMDTGRTSSWDKLRKGLELLGVTDNAVTAVVLTHCHFDHAENAAGMKTNYHSTIIVHESESDCLANGENPVIRGTNFLTRPLAALLTRTNLHKRFHYMPCASDIQIRNRYDLNQFGIPGYILHTPGHSPGSMSIIIEDEVAIVGDAMFGVVKGSVLPPFGDDLKQMIVSWKTLLDTGCTTYLPGHGNERTRDILKRQYNKYKKFYHLG